MTVSREEMLALADEIEGSDGLYLMGDKRQLGIKKTAQVIAALRSQGESAPADYVLMPREATRSMTMAGCDCLPSCVHVFGYAGEMLRKAYAKMVEVAAKPAAHSPPENVADYCAWLIEADEGASISYFQFEHDDDWTFSQDKAAHFARKQDAESVIAHYGWTRARAVEHMWPQVKRRTPSLSREERHPAMDWKLSGEACRMCGGAGRSGVFSCTHCGATGREPSVSSTEQQR
jgi:hypothetical protein